MAIRRYVKAAWAEVPEEHVARLAELVETYKARYGDDRRVDCDLTGDEGHARSLRIKHLRCRFTGRSDRVPIHGPGAVYRRGGYACGRERQNLHLAVELSADSWRQVGADTALIRSREPRYSRMPMLIAADVVSKVSKSMPVSSCGPSLRNQVARAPT